MRILRLLFPLFAFTLFAAAQTTTLTGTVASYASGSGYAISQGSGAQIPFSIDGSGNISLVVRNTSGYVITVVPPPGTALKPFAAVIPVQSGGSVSITTTLAANVPPSPSAPVTTNTLPALITAAINAQVPAVVTAGITAPAPKVAATVYAGPAVAPTGACTTGLWALAQDGTISYCKAATWGVAVTAP